MVAIASPGIEKAQALASLTGAARTYVDYRDLLAATDVDAVLTAVPIAANARVLMDSVAAGKHVIAEKPLAATVTEGREVLNACAATSKVVLIAENYRYRPDLLKAQTIISSGAVGEIFAFQLSVKFDIDAAVRKIWTERSWRQDAQHPGGFLLDAGVHPVSFLRDLLGEVEEVFARTLDRNPLIKGPDSLVMQLKLINGVAGQYLALYTAKVKQETVLQLSIFGSRGTMELNSGVLEWSSGPGTGERVRFSRSDRGYFGEWCNFIDAIEEVSPVISTPERALGDVEVIAAALLSATDGRPVRIGGSC